MTDASPGPGRDASPTPRGGACRWCRGELPTTARRDALFCKKACRQSAFRLRRRRTTFAVTDRPLVFAYADPPYPGLARRYYKDEPSFAGEVDHRALIAELEQGGYAGWALSTGAYALRDLLPLCPPHARVCPWVKPHGAHPWTFGLHNVWEPLIVVGGRQLPPGKRDALVALPARGGGELPGRKPIAFCAWLFDCLGMRAGDELVDLYPGSGIIGRAWAELGAVAPRGRDTSGADVSQRSSGDASPGCRSDLYASLDAVGETGRQRPPANASREDLGDRSRAALGDLSPGAGVDGALGAADPPRRRASGGTRLR